MDIQNVEVVRDREGERGAALVMALLFSLLLLSVTAAVLLEASMNSQNVTDAISEQQAYHAAESGIQSAVHVMRCQKNSVPGCSDVVANPLLNPSASPNPATDESNQINYIRAVTLGTSNTTGDTSTTARLSRWINYSSTCGASAAPCVPLGQPGYGFALQVSDPDNTSRYLSVSIAGKFYSNDGSTTQMTYNRDATGTLTPNNWLRVNYTAPNPIVNQDISGSTLTTSFGTFSFARGSSGGQIVPTKNRFEIVFNFTRPYMITKVLRGWIMPTTDPNALPVIYFDSQTLTVNGSRITLDLQANPSNGWGFVTTVLPPASPAGYAGTPSNVGGGGNAIGGTISPFEPTRLLVRSTGYGPRGARKELQAIIQKNFFNGVTAPAALTLVGPRTTSSPSSAFFFSAGQSSALTYSGFDAAAGATDIIPAIGTTDPDNLSCVEEYVANYPQSSGCSGTTGGGTNPFNGTVTGSPSNVTTEMPTWLQTPSALDYQVHQFASVAQSSGRYFANGQTPATWGDMATGTGITFCDGDVTLGQDQGDGGGILVVTGTLTLQGSFNFNGMIIVTGPGGVARAGGGDGNVYGNMVVAPYVNPRIVDDPAPADGVTYDLPAGIFLAPQYNMDGGGTSTLQFNSRSLSNGLTAVSNFVLGVMEK
ncbi:MAG TPA: hypothetical protein VL501_00995 [Pyrinomonadaceae bacterium]|nr:hypothetical protein [Pyrinomonadaceae bacterium]